MLSLSNKQSLTHQTTKQITKEPSTADSLTHLSAENRIDLSLFSGVRSDHQLIAYALGLGEDCLSGLQELADSVTRSAYQQIHCESFQASSTTYSNNLTELSEESEKSLKKLEQCRKQIHNKLTKWFLLKSKQTNLKRIRKNNLQSCRKALHLLKNLRDVPYTSEGQIMNMKDRLKTCGLVVVPQLVEKCVIKWAFNGLFYHKIIVVVEHSDNLRVIFEALLDNQDLMARLWREFFSQPLVSHGLYTKFKLFLKLKYFIDDRACNKNMFSIFQELIHRYIKLNLPKISQTELNKVQSLVQSNKNLHKFWQSIVQTQFEQICQKVLPYFSQIAQRTRKTASLFQQLITHRNKNIQQLNNLRFSSQMLRSVLGLDLLPSLDEIRQLVAVFENNQGFFNGFVLQNGISVNANDVKFCIFVESIKCLLFPIKTIIIAINKLVHRDKKERHYHNNRFAQKHIRTWQKLNEYTKKSTQLITTFSKQILTCKQISLNEFTEVDKKYDLPHKNTNNQLNLTVGQIFIIYNNTIGDRYLYLTNKLTSLLGQSNFKNRKTTDLDMESLMSLWGGLISQKISHHLVEEIQPANILQKVQFSQESILEIVENQFKIENDMKKLKQEVENLVVSRKNKVDDDIETKWNRIECKIWEHNLRTRDYTGLIGLSKHIKMDKKMKQLHENIYITIFKKIVE